MKNVRDFKTSSDACDALKDDISRLLSFIKANLPEGDSWPVAGDFSFIREELLNIAMFATNKETIEEVIDLIDAFKK